MRKKSWNKAIGGLVSASVSSLLEYTMTGGLSGWIPLLAGVAGAMEYLRSFGLFRLWQLWQSSGPGGRVHFMIAEKSSHVKVKRVSGLAMKASPGVVFHIISADFTKLFHAFVRPLFELMRYCRRELRPGEGTATTSVGARMETCQATRFPTRLAKACRAVGL